MATSGIGISEEEFLRGFGDALVEQRAALFVGAGASRSAGFVDWKDLLTDFAGELGLNLEVETDYVSVAQYHINQAGSRERLHAKLIAELSDGASETELHPALARLPINVYWTTNYDSLIEDSLEKLERKAIVRTTSSDLTNEPPGVECEVLKLHGDLGDPDSVIITREDYETYRYRHPQFRERLLADLVSRTFLFIGFGFTDPHLQYLLGELWSTLAKSGLRSHYAIARLEPETTPEGNPNYKAIQQAHRVRDLERYGVKTLLVDEYDDIPEILNTLYHRYLRRHVFVSGAFDDPNPRGDQWLKEFAQLLGLRLMESDYCLVSGFGLGLGPEVLSGALESLYKDGPSPNLDSRLVLRPFPYSTRDAELYTRYRRDMLRQAGSAVFIAGNRRADGQLEASPGVREEFEICRELGAYVIPVGSTGWRAAELWAEVDASFEEFFPDDLPRTPWELLNQDDTTPAQVVDALVELLDFLRPRVEWEDDSDD
jgi:hypothetical protein